MCKALEDIKAEGENKKLMDQIQKKLAKGQHIAQIADALEETPEVIEKLIAEMTVKN